MPRALGKQPANCSWGKKTREDMKTMDTLRYDSYLSIKLYTYNPHGRKDGRIQSKKNWERRQKKKKNA